MKKSIFQSIILLALIMVLACLFYLTPDKKSKNSHPVSSGSVSYIKPGSGMATLTEMLSPAKNHFLFTV